MKPGLQDREQLSVGGVAMGAFVGGFVGGVTGEGVGGRVGLGGFVGVTGEGVGGVFVGDDVTGDVVESSSPSNSDGDVVIVVGVPTGDVTGAFEASSSSPSTSEGDAVVVSSSSSPIVTGDAVGVVTTEQPLYGSISLLTTNDQAPFPS